MPRPRWWRRVRWVLALVGLVALATLPQGWRACRGAQRGREADELLAYLVAQAKQLQSKSGLPRQPAGPTPPIGSCCKQGGRCASDITQWSAPTWRALAFTIDDQHRFSYSYQPTPQGAILRAVGDADCDGEPAVVEVTLTVGPTGLTEHWARQAPGE